MSNFETAKYRMKQGFRELGLVALIGIANIAAFAFIIAMIFVLLRTLIRIS